MELRVTLAKVPSVEVDGVLYPIFFSVLGIKEWAEYRNKDFASVLESGWQLTEMSDNDILRLLLIGLRGGEARRHMVEGGSPRVISEDLAKRVLEYYHLNDVFLLLLRAWNRPSELGADENPPDGPQHGGNSLD